MTSPDLLDDMVAMISKLTTTTTIEASTMRAPSRRTPPVKPLSLKKRRQQKPTTVTNKQQRVDAPPPSLPPLSEDVAGYPVARNYVSTLEGELQRQVDNQLDEYDRYVNEFNQRKYVFVPIAPDSAENETERTLVDRYNTTLAKAFAPNTRAADGVIQIDKQVVAQRFDTLQQSLIRYYSRRGDNNSNDGGLANLLAYTDVEANIADLVSTLRGFDAATIEPPTAPAAKILLPIMLMFQQLCSPESVTQVVAELTEKEREERLAFFNKLLVTHTIVLAHEEEKEQQQQQQKNLFGNGISGTSREDEQEPVERRVFKRVMHNMVAIYKVAVFRQLDPDYGERKDDEEEEEDVMDVDDDDENVMDISANSGLTQARGSKRPVPMDDDDDDPTPPPPAVTQVRGSKRPVPMDDDDDDPTLTQARGSRRPVPPAPVVVVPNIANVNQPPPPPLPPAQQQQQQPAGILGRALGPIVEGLGAFLDQMAGTIVVAEPTSPITTPTGKETPQQEYDRLSKKDYKTDEDIARMQQLLSIVVTSEKKRSDEMKQAFAHILLTTAKILILSLSGHVLLETIRWVGGVGLGGLAASVIMTPKEAILHMAETSPETNRRMADLKQEYDNAIMDEAEFKQSLTELLQDAENATFVTNPGLYMNMTTLPPVGSTVSAPETHLAPAMRIMTDRILNSATTIFATEKDRLATTYRQYGGGQLPPDDQVVTAKAWTNTRALLGAFFTDMRAVQQAFPEGMGPRTDNVFNEGERHQIAEHRRTLLKDVFVQNPQYASIQQAVMPMSETSAATSVFAEAMEQLQAARDVTNAQLKGLQKLDSRVLDAVTRVNQEMDKVVDVEYIMDDHMRRVLVERLRATTPGLTIEQAVRIANQPNAISMLYKLTSDMAEGRFDELIANGVDAARAHHREHSSTVTDEKLRQEERTAASQAVRSHLIKNVSWQVLSTLSLVSGYIMAETCAIEPSTFGLAVTGTIGTLNMLNLGFAWRAQHALAQKQLVGEQERIGAATQDDLTAAMKQHDRILKAAQYTNTVAQVANFVSMAATTFSTLSSFTTNSEMVQALTRAATSNSIILNALQVGADFSVFAINTMFVSPVMNAAFYLPKAIVVTTGTMASLVLRGLRVGDYLDEIGMVTTDVSYTLIAALLGALAFIKLNRFRHSLEPTPANPGGGVRDYLKAMLASAQRTAQTAHGINAFFGDARKLTMAAHTLSSLSLGPANQQARYLNELLAFDMVPTVSELVTKLWNPEYERVQQFRVAESGGTLSQGIRSFSQWLRDMFAGTGPLPALPPPRDVLAGTTMTTMLDAAILSPNTDEATRMAFENLNHTATALGYSLHERAAAFQQFNASQPGYARDMVRSLSLSPEARATCEDLLGNGTDAGKLFLYTFDVTTTTD